MNTIRLAELAHEANRAICECADDHSQVPWEFAPAWQKHSVMDGIEFLRNNPTATSEQNHENWMKTKKADGWVYGEVKDARKKTHPCMVPYDELPFEQKVKDYVFRALVLTLDAQRAEAD